MCFSLSISIIALDSSVIPFPTPRFFDGTSDPADFGAYKNHILYSTRQAMISHAKNFLSCRGAIRYSALSYRNCQRFETSERINHRYNFPKQKPLDWLQIHMAPLGILLVYSAVLASMLHRNKITACSMTGNAFQNFSTHK